jgi:hypothetical protein
MVGIFVISVELLNTPIRNDGRGIKVFSSTLINTPDFYASHRKKRERECHDLLSVCSVSLAAVHKSSIG